jgi:hypothetical protein
MHSSVCHNMLCTDARQIVECLSTHVAAQQTAHAISWLHTAHAALHNKLTKHQLDSHHAQHNSGESL